MNTNESESVFLIVYPIDLSKLKVNYQYKEQTIKQGLSKKGIYISENNIWYHVSTTCKSSDIWSNYSESSKPVYANYVERIKTQANQLPLDITFINKSLHVFYNDIVKIEIEPIKERLKHVFPNAYHQKERMYSIHIKIKTHYNHLNIKEQNEISTFLSLINYS